MLDYFSPDDIIGYIGVFLLMARFIPVMIKEIKNLKNLNYKTIEPIFIAIEATSSTFMMTSAIMKNSMPFIMANAFTVLSYIVLSNIYIVKCILKYQCFQKTLWGHLRQKSNISFIIKLKFTFQNKIYHLEPFDNY